MPPAPSGTDAMPEAWLVRFGRTVASQAVDAIGGRMEGMEGVHDTHVTVGGARQKRCEIRDRYRSSVADEGLRRMAKRYAIEKARRGQPA